MGCLLHSSIITAGFKFSDVQRPFENVASWEMGSCENSTTHLYVLNYLQNLGTDNCSYTKSLREPGMNCFLFWVVDFVCFGWRREKEVELEAKNIFCRKQSGLGDCPPF